MLVTSSLIWLLLASSLLVLAIIGLDSDGLLLVTGVSALMLTLVTGLLPLPMVGQVLIFALMVGAGYGTLRRWSASREARAIPPAARAEIAEVILDFDAEGRGRVRWQGQSWAALNLQPESTLPAGSQVSVMGRDGTELRVLPR
jgi:membrane protein implicated in regulation of membrane protease activity